MGHKVTTEEKRAVLETLGFTFRVRCQNGLILYFGSTPNRHSVGANYGSMEVAVLKTWECYERIQNES
jgi:hypothetical protein